MSIFYDTAVPKLTDVRINNQIIEFHYINVFTNRTGHYTYLIESDSKYKKYKFIDFVLNHIILKDVMSRFDVTLEGLLIKCKFLKVDDQIYISKLYQNLMKQIFEEKKFPSILTADACIDLISSLLNDNYKLVQKEDNKYRAIFSLSNSHRVKANSSTYNFTIQKKSNPNVRTIAYMRPPLDSNYYRIGDEYIPHVYEFLRISAS